MASKFPIDLLERVVATYVETYLGLMLASGLGVQFITDVSNANKALIACLPTLIALLKGVAAKFIGSSNTAALLPVKDDTPVSINGLHDGLL